MRFPPLPVLRGRVGVGVFSLGFRAKSPHPCPPPEYRERGELARARFVRHGETVQDPHMNNGCPSFLKGFEHSAYELHEEHVNPAFVKMLRTIGFDKRYVRGQGCYLWDE